MTCLANSSHAAVSCSIEARRGNCEKMKVGKTKGMWVWLVKRHLLCASDSNGLAVNFFFEAYLDQFGALSFKFDLEKLLLGILSICHEHQMLFTNAFQPLASLDACAHTYLEQNLQLHNRRGTTVLDELCGAGSKIVRKTSKCACIKVFAAT